MVLRLGGRRHTAHGPAMETTLERDDLVPLPLGPEADEFDGCLVGLGSGVTEKSLAAKGAVTEQAGPLALGFDVPGVWHVNQFRDLLLYGFNDRCRAMAQQIAAPSREQIEITPTVGVPDS